MRVIYIAGASHSGSTLLDMMLNAHPEIVSVGEVLKLNRFKRSKSGTPKEPKCACGARGLLRCDFWARVNERIRDTHGKTFVDLYVNDYRQYAGETDPNLILFKAIAEVAEKKFVVDSSKMPRRLRHLVDIPALNVHPIHLIRDPRGQIASVIAKNGLLKSIFEHEVVQAQTRRILKSVPHVIVNYEVLVNYPEDTLQRILTPLGLKFVPQQLKWAQQERHSFAGNHVRMQKESELVLDERWKHRLSPRQISLIDLGTFLSRRSRPNA
jgi:hypothetical protein